VSELGRFASTILDPAAPLARTAGLFVFGFSCGHLKRSVTLLAFGLKPFIDFSFDPGNAVFTEADRGGELAIFNKPPDMNRVK
jgi:hypothetical protein